MLKGGTRFDVQLDEAHARKLRALAARTHVNPDALARSLLSTARSAMSGSASLVRVAFPV